MTIMNKERIEIVKKNKVWLLLIVSLMIVAVFSVFVVSCNKKNLGSEEKEQIADELQLMSDYLDQVTGELADTESKVQSLVEISPEALAEMEESLQVLKETVAADENYIYQYEQLLETGEGTAILSEKDLETIREKYGFTLEQIGQLEKNLILLKSENTSIEDKEAAMKETYEIITNASSNLSKIEELISAALEKAIKDGVDQENSSYVLLEEWQSSISSVLENEMKNLLESVVMIQASLEEKISEAKIQIDEAKAAIEELLQNMNSSDTMEYGTMTNQLDSIKSLVDLLQDSLWGIHDEIENSVGYLDESNPNDAAALEVLKELQEQTSIYSQAFETYMEMSWATVEDALQKYIEQLGSEYQYTADELANIRDYLNQLDENVVNNQEKLESLQTNTDSDFTDINEAYRALEEMMSNYYELLVSFSEGEESNHEKTTVSLEDIQTGVTDTLASIEDAETVLSGLLNEMSSQNATDQETLEKAVEEVNKNVTETQAAILEALELMSEDDQLMQDELLTTLETMNTDLTLILEDNLATITERVDLLDTTLSLQLANIHTQIVTTQDEITMILNSMSQQDVEHYNSLTEQIDEVKADIGTMEVNLQKVYDDLETLILDLEATENANHSVTIATLTSVKDTVQSDLSENMVSINASFASLDDNLETLFTDLTCNIDTQFTELTTATNNNHADLKSYVTEELGNITENLNVLFQYVSNGKQSLASALLTKGITIAEDATFEEIKQAILNVPQELLIGVQELPGTISYDYHYHVDGSGNELHTTSNSSQGGCYTVPIYHAHTGSATSGGGCYTVPIYHTHTSACYSEGSHTSSCASHTEYHTYDCGTVHDYDGDGHGCDGFLVYDCGGHTYLSCGLSSGIIGYQLGCGKDTTTIEGYGTGCGLSDGQIIAAHIVYIQEAMGASTFSMALIADEIPCADASCSECQSEEIQIQDLEDVEQTESEVVVDTSSEKPDVSTEEVGDGLDTNVDELNPGDALEGSVEPEITVEPEGTVELEQTVELEPTEGTQETAENVAEQTIVEGVANDAMEPNDTTVQTTQ